MACFLSESHEKGKPSDILMISEVDDCKYQIPYRFPSEDGEPGVKIIMSLTRGILNYYKQQTERCKPEMSINHVSVHLEQLVSSDSISPFQNLLRCCSMTGHCYANTLLNANQNDTHAILPLSCCSFHSINWGTGSQHWASEWFPPLLSSFTSYIKPAKRSWSDWAPSLISLSPLSSVNIKVLIRHGLHWVEFLVLPWYQGSAVTHCRRDDKFSFSSSFFFFFFPTAIFALLRRKTCCSNLEKKQVVEQNMSDDTRGAAGSSERHQNKLWSLI